MSPKTFSFALLACALGGACAVDSSDPASGQSKQAVRDQLQRAAGSSASSAGAAPTAAASSAVASRRLPPDLCLLHKWYGDGECDAWCPLGDSDDCAPSAGGGVACATFFSLADGHCDLNDPCGPVQDEDCQKGSGAGQPCAPAPTPQPGDGKCEPHSYAELKADPDCATLVCPDLFSPADGKCDAKRPCDFVIDEDCAKSGPNAGGTPPCATDPATGAGCVPPSPGGVVCTAIRYATNGKCEAAPGCEANDPQDCAVGCIDIAYAANGKCEAAPGCEASDPRDCPVACDAIAYPANGKCEAPPGCEANDAKDCPVECLDILYAANGVCQAAPGCESSDPDC